MVSLHPAAAAEVMPSAVTSSWSWTTLLAVPSFRWMATKRSASRPCPPRLVLHRINVLCMICSNLSIFNLLNHFFHAFEGCNFPTISAQLRVQNSRYFTLRLAAPPQTIAPIRQSSKAVEAFRKPLHDKSQVWGMQASMSGFHQTATPINVFKNIYLLL